MLEIRIRPATDADSDGILGCLHAAFEPYRDAYSAEGFADTTLNEETVRQRLRRMDVLVATTGSDVIVGTVAGSANHEEGHVRGMAVRPEHAGSGVGRVLLETIEEHLRGQGCTRVTLDTTLPLTRAISFYERNGYRRSGKIGDFFGMELIEYVKTL